jgi:hypothetical protein
VSRGQVEASAELAWLHHFTRPAAEGVGEATERSGEPGDRDGLFAFRLVVRSARLFLSVRTGGVSVVCSGPHSPPDGRGPTGSATPSPARRSTIGGLYDHRPVDPLSALIPETARSPADLGEMRRPSSPPGTASGPAQPSPVAALGRIHAPSPATGMAMIMGVVLDADHSGPRKIDKRLISLRSISRIPRIERRQSP